MPQPSTQRPILDSFLPFAPISDEQTPREMIPAGECDQLGLPVPGGRTNGQSAPFGADEILAPLNHATAVTVNGSHEPAVIDQVVGRTPMGLNGNGFGHVN